MVRTFPRTPGRPWRARLSLVLAVVFLATGPAFLGSQEPAPPPPDKKPKAKPAKGKGELKELPPVTTDNKNTLVRKYKDKLKVTASTTYPGWPAEKVIDGELKTSWFSATGDTVTKGTKPWVEITFPEDVTVKRVTVLGNREPAWLKGYTILAGSVELLDGDGKRLFYDDNDGIGNFRDFDFKPKKPLGKVAPSASPRWATRATRTRLTTSPSRRFRLNEDEAKKDNALSGWRRGLVPGNEKRHGPHDTSASYSRFASSVLICSMQRSWASSWALISRAICSRRSSWALRVRTIRSRSSFSEGRSPRASRFSRNCAAARCGSRLRSSCSRCSCFCTSLARCCCSSTSRSSSSVRWLR